MSMEETKILKPSRIFVVKLGSSASAKKKAFLNVHGDQSLVGMFLHESIYYHKDKKGEQCEVYNVCYPKKYAYDPDMKHTVGYFSICCCILYFISLLFN
jgi:hypothetical protein